MSNATPVRPNILWISLEDTSPRFGCTGDPLARTPNIDRLAAQGVRFPNTFSTAGVCAPSRFAVITGVYAVSAGAHHMRTTHTNSLMPELPTPYAAVPPPYVKCFPEYLRAAGYFCTNNKKTDYQFPPPFTTWDERGEHAHWRHRADGQPFFSVFNPTFTHESGMWHRPERPIHTDPDAVTLPPYLPQTRKAREALARHYDNLAKADEVVGRLLAELEEDGLADDTVVMLWSDHGEGLPRAKRWPYDAGIRVPLVVRWPGQIDPGTVSNDLVSLIDLPPTVLSIAGLDVPPYMQGRPFLTERKAPRTHVHAARDRHDTTYDTVRAVRDKRYKYIRHSYPGQPYLSWIPYRNRHPVMQEMWRLYAEDQLEGPQRLMFQRRPAEELYDCENDPFEMENLAGDPAHEETLARLRTALDDWRRDVGDLGDVPEAQMAAAFWPDGQQPQTAPVVFVPLGPASHGIETAQSDVSVAGPLIVQLQSATQGASIGYTTEPGDDAEWRLYTEPIRLPRGTTTLRAKAVRIGYEESDERAVTFTVNESLSEHPL